jgi:hypothetical protein
VDGSIGWVLTNEHSSFFGRGEGWKEKRWGFPAVEAKASLFPSSFFFFAVKNSED